MTQRKYLKEIIRSGMTLCLVVQTGAEGNLGLSLNLPFGQLGKSWCFLPRQN